jgi:hypothetical protein
VFIQSVLLVLLWSAPVAAVMYAARRPWFSLLLVSRLWVLSLLWFARGFGCCFFCSLLLGWSCLLVTVAAACFGRVCLLPSFLVFVGRSVTGFVPEFRCLYF